MRNAGCGAFLGQEQHSGAASRGGSVSLHVQGSQFADWLHSPASPLVTGLLCCAAHQEISLRCDGMGAPNLRPVNIIWQHVGMH